MSTPKQLAAFAASLRARGMEPREYEGLEELYLATRKIWSHMCILDTGNRAGWEPLFPLANAWSEGNACVAPWSALEPDGCLGNRRFPEVRLG